MMICAMIPATLILCGEWGFNEAVFGYRGTAQLLATRLFLVIAEKLIHRLR